MKYLKTLLLFPLVFSFGESSFAQAQRTMSFDANTSLILRELNAVIVQNDDGIQVDMIMGGHNEATGSEDDLQRGDIILMMNGERITEITGMRKIYEDLQEEDEIKIGVRRGEQRFIVRASKGDFPESGPGQMVMRIEGAGNNPPVVLAELGLVVAYIDDQIQIQALLEPLMPDELKSEELDGFQIITINGERFEDAESVQSFLTELEVGDSIDLVVEKDGDQKVFTLEKSEPRGGVRMSIDG